MKLILVAKLAAVALLTGCSTSAPYESRNHTFAVADKVTNSTVVLAPQKAVEFSTFAAKESASVEREIRGSLIDAMKQFGRFQSGAPTGATITIDAVRHGVTSAGDQLFAPIVEAEIHATGAKGEKLMRRTHSATSGEIHTLEQFIQDPELYRRAIAIAAQKLALELAADL